MTDLRPLAQWFRAPAHLTPRAWDVMREPALGFDMDWSERNGRWERAFPPFGQKVTACIKATGGAIDFETLTSDAETGQMTLELPAPDRLPWREPKLPKGEFEIELLAVHPHPEAPDLRATVTVKRNKSGLGLVSPFEWKRVQ